VLADAPALYYRLGESSGTVRRGLLGQRARRDDRGSPLMGSGPLATDSDLALYFDA